MRIRIQVIFIIFLFTCFQGLAQNLSNRGKEFWAGYGHHQYMETGSNTQEMVIYLSAEEPATVTVSIDSTTWSRTYKIPANTVIATDLIPKAGAVDARLYDFPVSFGGNGGEGLFRKKGVHIKSDVPIVAYAHIYGSAASGATMLMPVETWGYSYSSINSAQYYAPNCFSWFYVIAQKDSTVIEITPSVPSVLGKPAKISFQVMLMKGQIYQYTAAIKSGSEGYNATGSTVRSVANASGNCYPIAFFAGSSRTTNPGSCGTGGGDNDNQQLFPFQAWGKRYLTAPTSSSSSAATPMINYFKVVVKDPATKVKLNGSTAGLGPLINNLYYEFASSTANYIEADQPIMVAQFMSGGTACLGGPGNVGDPEMIILSPMEQGINRIGFYRNVVEKMNVNYLTLIIPTEGVKTLSIDGSQTFYTYAHPNMPGYSVVVKRWAPAAKAQCIVKSDSAFTAITYGLGSVESYGYNAGTMINNLAAIGAIHNALDTTATSHAFTCTNTPVELSVMMGYKPTKMVWKLSKLGSDITPNTDVTDLAPVPVDSTDVKGLKYYKYRLPGTYTFNRADTFKVPVLCTHPKIESCNNTEEVSFEVIVKTKLQPDFSFTHTTGCTLDTVYFSGNTTTADGFRTGSWAWEFPGGKKDSVQSPKELLPPGNQTVKLSIISSEGCVGDTTKTITVYDKPKASFSVSPVAICEGGGMSFTPTSTYGGPAAITDWYWTYGDGKDTTAGNSVTQSHTFNTYGSYKARHAVKVSNTCVSDTAEQIITVYAKPQPAFDYPKDCLPVNGIAQFKNTTTVPDGQALQAYAWNFGDPNATATNPNTSTLKDPTHYYATGNYDVYLSVTTVNGCTKDTLVQAAFNPRPQLVYPALSPVCENVVGAISVAKASVTNGVPGKGFYKSQSPGLDSAGMFTPSVAGYGNHTIWYVFRTTTGCADSISQTILVHAKPVTSFTYPAGGCLPPNGQAQLNSTTTIADGQSMTYSWNFDDPNANAVNPNTSTIQNPTHNFVEGSYNIQLNVSSSNGCTDDTTTTVVFNVKPQLTYPALPAVCESQAGPVSIATAKVVNGATGTGVYSGPGTDTAGMFTASVAGAGVHTIRYIFTTSGGCQDTVYSSITVYPKPKVAFTVTSNICLDQMATVTDNSSITTGTIQQWNWNFGDGSTASYTNNNAFTKSFAANQTYIVKLVAISDKGCSSDTASQPVTVHALPVAGFELPTGICMPGGNAVFENKSTIAENTTLSYEWNFGDGSAMNSATNPSHVYAAKGNYNVSLTTTSAYGCRHSASKTLNSFYDKPQAQFNVSPEDLCQGANNYFTDLSTAPTSSITNWKWEFGDGSTAGSQNPTKKYDQPGNYAVRLTVTNAVGCTSEAYSKQVNVYLQPVIDAGPSFAVPEGTVIQFDARANDSAALAFSWSPSSGLSNPAVLRPSMVALYDQTYTLTATGQHDCKASDFLTVKILKPVKIPNAFSPNGDGVNDRWELPNLADYPGATVQVFNRYGQLVFYSAGYATPWDGSYKGSPLPMATYYYVIDRKNGFVPLSGSVTIVK